MNIETFSLVSKIFRLKKENDKDISDITFKYHLTVYVVCIYGLAFVTHMLCAHAFITYVFLGVYIKFYITNWNISDYILIFKL